MKHMDSLTLPLVYQEKSDAYTHIVRDSKGRFVQQFPQDTTGRAEEFARLFAAVPDLLEALKNLQTQIQQVSDGDRPYTGFDTELIDAAIAKAEPNEEIKKCQDCREDFRACDSLWAPDFCDDCGPF